MDDLHEDEAREEAYTDALSEDERAEYEAARDRSRAARNKRIRETLAARYGKAVA